MMRPKIFGIILSFLFLVFFLISSESMAEPVTVMIDPASTVVLNGTSFSVNLLADIPEPIIGWGLDVSFDPTILSLTGLTIGTSFLPVSSPDGDNIAGLAPPPDPICGDNILLAALSFNAINIGSSSIIISYTSGDLTEGFALVAIGKFADVFSINGTVNSVNPVPEPTTILLFGLGLMGLAGARKRF